MIDKPDNTESQVDLTGQTIGGFTIIRRLGRGGMADVYLARQTSLDRNVAIKILKPDLAHDASYIARFKREAQAAAKLVQANIVGVYEVGDVDGLHYIAQEYVVGKNLREYLARHGAVKPVMAVNVLRQVALAIQKADEHNVTHRDIKPENIMLSPGGEVKVADFGLARINDENTKHLTQIGITMGTPLYMSPEQVEGQLVDVRSDIYSLGVTAYHMLAGKPPFDGENALAIAVQHVKNDPDPLSEIRPDAPKELLELINQMMSKSVTDRPQNAGQLLKEIKNIKIEVDQDWDQLVETLAIENSVTKPSIRLEESRLEVTRQLQRAMKGNLRSWWTELSTILGFLVLLATGVFVGFWITNQHPTQDPLAIANSEIDGIPNSESAKEQYELAINYHPKEIAYYQAVIDYFPLDVAGDSLNQTRLYQDRAKERQAEIYVLSGDFEKAEKIYRELANADYQSRLPVVGHAGLAIVYHEQNKPELAKREIIQVEREANNVLNTFLKKKFENVREYYFDQPVEGAVSGSDEPQSSRLQSQ